ncbi:MAG: AhpC/TSA family protein [Bacteroidales bacterium]|jgi:thiol-disulfide isomerase/thioredoxin|nr:AhpC/TSA family protein [Bacteroidales bacterium]
MKHFIWMATAVFALYACVEHQGYVISGVAEGCDGQTVYLQQLHHSEPVITDSTVVKKGKFNLKGTVVCPDFHLIYIGNNGPIQFFIENSKINIVVHKDSIHTSVVKGSEENDLFVSLREKLEEFEKQTRHLNDEYMSLQLTEDQDEEKETSLLSQMNRLSVERTEFLRGFAESHPNSVVSAFVIDNVLSHYMDIEELGHIIDAFEADHPSQWVQSTKERLAVVRRTKTGQPFTDMSMRDPDGNPVKLSDYAGQGKYLLVDFWASWCRPCRMANPQMVELYRKYKDRGFEIAGVSLDRNGQEWVEAISTDMLEWKHMSDLKFWESDAVKLYAVNSIPYTILLDRQGIIIEKGIRIDVLDALLNGLLNDRQATE